MTVPPAQRHRYNLFLNRQDMRRHLHLLRQTRGRKHISGPQGDRYNLEEIFADEQAVTIIEWAERLTDLPADATRVDIEYLSDSERRIHIAPAS